MTIAFIHPHKAFLPEIDSYQIFFSTFSIKTIVVRPEEIKNINADVEWHFMGTDYSKKKSGVVKIHEYSSASVPPFSKWKDLIKKYINIKPDYRIFNNDYVKSQFQLNDKVPFGIRDYGIHLNEARILADPKKIYDFIYVGTTDKKRKLAKFFKKFTTGNLQTHTLLVISKDYKNLAKKLSPFTNIQFEGPVNSADIYQHIIKAKYAINFIPDLIPYNKSTSAKLLDYLMCGVPVITTSYAWVKYFQQKYGGNYFYLNDDLSNFTWEKISDFNYSFPELNEWSWEKQIRRSGVLEFLQSKFPELSF